jgi:ATP-dependent RNA helicase DBP3
MQPTLFHHIASLKDMGFEKEIKRVMSSIKPDRQTLMFSATWPREVQDIGHGYMKNPVRVNVGEKDRLTANHRVEQTVEVMEGGEKDGRLLQLLEKYHKGQKERMLIFGLYKKETDRVATMLQRKGHGARFFDRNLHSRMPLVPTPARLKRAGV